MKHAIDFRHPERLSTEFTREGGYFVLVLAFVLTGAMLRDINLMMLIAGVMIGLWYCNWRQAASMIRKLALRRLCPDAICAGDMLVVDVEVANDAKRKNKRGIVVRDSITRSFRGRIVEKASTQVGFDTIPSNREQRCSYQGRMWTRGQYELGPLEVSCSFPFGLMRRRGIVNDHQRLTVFPRVGRLAPAWSRVHEETFAGPQRMRKQQTQTEGDFYGLRDWREGDSHRWIHWRTSARRAKLMVRQYERQRRQDVILLLDLWEPTKATTAQTDAVELAVSFAATVLADLCRRGGSHVSLVSGGRDPIAVHGVASQGLLGEMMSALAVAEAAETDRLSELAIQALQSAARHAKLLVVSTRTIDVTTLSRLPQLPKRIAHRLAEMRVIGIDTSSQQIDEYFTLD